MSTEKIEAAQFAAIIKQAREQKGWTRYQLSKASGIGEAHLMRIEQGLYCVRIDVANRLCKALEIAIKFPLN